MFADTKLVLPAKQGLVVALLLAVGFGSSWLGFLRSTRVWAQVQAQQLDGINLKVSPPTAFLKVQPGSSAQHVITLENAGETDLEITPNLVDFRADNQTGQPVLSSKLSFPYFDLSANQLDPIVLKARKKAQLKLVIKPPAEAQDQEYPVSILFRAQPVTSELDDKPSVGNTALTEVIASNLVILVSDQLLPPNQLVVQDIQTPRLIDTFRAWEFTPLLQNRGFAAQVASGSAKLLNWRNQSIQEYQIFPSAVLGLSQRQAQAINPTQPGQLGPFLIKKQFLLGVYKISVELNPTAGGGDSIQGAPLEKKVIILPYFALISVLILSGVSLGVVFLVRFWRKKVGSA